MGLEQGRCVAQQILNRVEYAVLEGIHSRNDNNTQDSYEQGMRVVRAIRRDKLALEEEMADLNQEGKMLSLDYAAKDLIKRFITSF